MKEHGQIETNVGGGELWEPGKRKEKGKLVVRCDSIQQWLRLSALFTKRGSFSLQCRITNCRKDICQYTTAIHQLLSSGQVSPFHSSSF
jgi:hypothetical protein